MNIKKLDSFNKSFLEFLKSENRNPEIIEELTSPIIVNDEYFGYEIKMVNGETRTNYFIENKKKVLTQVGTQVAPILLTNDSPELIDQKENVFVTEGKTDAFAIHSASSQTLVILGANSGSSIKTHEEELKKQLPEDHYRFYIVFDNDRAGTNGSLAVAKNLHEVFPNSELYLIDWTTHPDVKDIREFINIKGNSIQDVLKLCRPISNKQLDIENIISNESKEKGQDNEHCFKKINLDKFDFFTDINGLTFMSNSNSSLSSPLASEDSKRILSKEVYDQTGKIFNRNKIEELIRFIEMDKLSTDIFEVSIRTASRNNNDNDTYYYDLGRTDSKILSISKGGLEELVDHTIKFKRPKTSAVLEYTKGNASDVLKLLNPYLNLSSQNDLILLIAFIIKSILGKSGASPILVIEGEQGSSKTTTTKFLKKLIDPSNSDVKRLPTKLDDLHNYAINNYLLCFDNLSGLSHQISDELCVISTGGAISKRELYSNETEFSRNIQRPVILNGIEDIGERPDFLERTITIHLPAISPSNRKSEIDLWKQIDSSLPIIMGALFDLAQKVVKLKNEIQFKNLSRMTEFYKIGICIEKILDFRNDFFNQAIIKNKAGQLNQIIATNPLLITVASLMNNQSEYHGSPHQLFGLLKDLAISKKFNHGFPQNPACLTKELKRHRTTLNQLGIDFFNDKNSQGRFIILKKMENIPSQLTFPSKTIQHEAQNDN